MAILSLKIFFLERDRNQLFLSFAAAEKKFQKKISKFFFMAFSMKLEIKKISDSWVETLEEFFFIFLLEVFSKLGVLTKSLEFEKASV